MNAVSVKFNRHDCVQVLKNVKNFVMSNCFGIIAML